MPSDIFISYARRDNGPASPGQVGWITAFVDSLKREHRRFSTVDLSIFFDTAEIHVMDDWEHRLLDALRESKLLLAFLSPSYFDSFYCRREWETYVQHELEYAIGGEGVAPIYFVEVPGFEGGRVEQQIAGWVDDLRRRQFFDLRPWRDGGIEALQHEDVRRRLELLDQQIAVRLDRISRVREAPGTVERHNATFVGRREELRRLRRMLALGRVGVITAVQGLGGVGKTALANEYAHAFAAEYPGGRWLVRCEDQSDLRLALLQLATPLQIELTDPEKKDPELACRRVLVELEQCTLAARGESLTNPACLLVLDNVNNPELLSAEQTARLPKAPWLHLLVTSRLEPHLPRHAERNRAEGSRVSLTG